VANPVVRVELPGGCDPAAMDHASLLAAIQTQAAAVGIRIRVFNGTFFEAATSANHPVRITFLTMTLESKPPPPAAPTSPALLESP